MKKKKKHRPWNKDLKGDLAHFLKRKRLAEKRTAKCNFVFGGKRKDGRDE